VILFNLHRTEDFSRLLLLNRLSAFPHRPALDSFSLAFRRTFRQHLVSRQFLRGTHLLHIQVARYTVPIIDQLLCSIKKDWKQLGLGDDQAAALEAMGTL
jgi:hypothetical protein